MKKAFPIFLWILLMACFSCDDEPRLKDGCFRVKVVKEICGNTVLQVVGRDLPNGVGNSWTDADDNTYRNVFTTKLNPCDPNYPENGEEFYIKIVEDSYGLNCAACRAIVSNPPEPYLNVIISNDCELGKTDL